MVDIEKLLEEIIEDDINKRPDELVAAIRQAGPPVARITGRRSLPEAVSTEVKKSAS